MKLDNEESHSQYMEDSLKAKKQASEIPEVSSILSTSESKMEWWDEIWGLVRKRDL